MSGDFESQEYRIHWTFVETLVGLSSNGCSGTKQPSRSSRSTRKQHGIVRSCGSQAAAARHDRCQCFISLRERTRLRPGSGGEMLPGRAVSRAAQRRKRNEMVRTCHRCLQRSGQGMEALFCSKFSSILQPNLLYTDSVPRSTPASKAQIVASSTTRHVKCSRMQTNGFSASEKTCTRPTEPPRTAFAWESQSFAPAAWINTSDQNKEDVLKPEASTIHYPPTK